MLVTVDFRWVNTWNHYRLILFQMKIRKKNSLWYIPPIDLLILLIGGQLWRYPWKHSRQWQWICWLRCNCYVDSSWSPPNYRTNFIFPPLVPLSNSRRIIKIIAFFLFKCFEKALIQQRLTYVEAPPSTNESEAFPYEPAAAYIRTSRAGGAQSTLDLGDGRTGGPGATKVGPGGHRGQRGLEATFSNSGTKRGEKTGQTNQKKTKK